MENLITFKKDKTGITIHIPTELLQFVTDNNPNYPMSVLDTNKLVEEVKGQLEGGLYNPVSGLTKFQELVDEAIISVSEYSDCIEPNY